MLNKIYKGKKFGLNGKIINLNKKSLKFFKKKFFYKYFLLFCHKNNLNYSRISFIIPKKKIKFSYKRNQIKRIIKESFRLNQHKLINLDFLLIVNFNITYLSKIIIRKEINFIFSEFFYDKKSSNNFY
ncbi:MAG: ribonuclease P protein component [Enterobacteriaceae bacterium]